VTTLIEGREAAGVSKRAINYALNLGTIHNEATVQPPVANRLAAQGHTNVGKAAASPPSWTRPRAPSATAASASAAG
jgi:hypothetical protein